MQGVGLSISKAHNLVDLLGVLRLRHPSLRALRRGLHFLTHFAVDTRYPGDNATRRQATSALHWAVRVRGEARALLGLRSGRNWSM
jgi:hypothetical protein